MAKQLQLRRGTTSQHSTFTGANGEVTIDTDKKVVVVHDGTTAGGIPLAKQITVDTKVSKVTSTDNAIVRFNGTTGDLQKSGVFIDDNNNVGMGTSSPVFSLDIVNTSTTGTSTDNAIIRLKSNNRNSALQLDTIGGSYAGVISNYANGTNVSQLKFDANGNILSILPNGGLGYGSGAGGTVTQLTSKNTAVTLNKPTGTITCSNSSLGANTHVTFLLNNSLIQAGDQLLVNMVYGTGTINVYTITSEVSTSGVAAINIWNFNQSTAFSEAIQIRFSIIKGATA